MPDHRPAPPLARPQAPGRMHRARLGPREPAFDAPASQPLLLSALAAGQDMTSSCRNGTCRACIRRLDSGQVRYDIEWPGLSAEEKAQGYILPCVAHPVSDLVLQPLAHRHP